MVNVTKGVHLNGNQIGELVFNIWKRIFHPPLIREFVNHLLKRFSSTEIIVPTTGRDVLLRELGLALPLIN